MKKEIYSRVTCFAPGNYVAVHIAEFSGRTKNYTIINQNDFLKKFVKISYMPNIFGNPSLNVFCQPQIELLYNPKYEFRIERVGKKEEYKIILDDIREPVVTYRKVK